MKSPGAKLPAWLRTPFRPSDAHGTKRLLRAHGLRTVCESARCPNLGGCFLEKTATFLILGPVCTRGCGFCAVGKGSLAPPDPCEPDRLASAARAMGLSYVVITMVTRDDLADGGAGHLAATMGEVRAQLPSAKIEVLTSDFGGNRDALRTVLSAVPHVFNHNIETVPRLYDRVRPGASYTRSLDILRYASEWTPAVPVKSGFMVGLGETEKEIVSLMASLRNAGCRILTIGQYLQPTKESLPVDNYLVPEKFREFETLGREMGFSAVYAGPLVRSSFSAGKAYREFCDHSSRTTSSGHL